MRMLLATCGALVLALAGCSDNYGGGSSPTPSQSPGQGNAPVSVDANETDFSIALSKQDFSPGAYTFQVHNNGKFPHNLKVNGPGVNSESSPTIQPGQSGTLAVTLQSGRYELWCGVDAHKDKGMTMTITVAGAASATTVPGGY